MEITLGLTKTLFCDKLELSMKKTTVIPVYFAPRDEVIGRTVTVQVTPIRRPSSWPWYLTGIAVAGIVLLVIICLLF